MIVPNYYENLQVLHENTMPYRAYYIPASKPMGTLVHDREKLGSLPVAEEIGNLNIIKVFMTYRRSSIGRRH